MYCLIVHDCKVARLTLQLSLIYWPRSQQLRGPLLRHTEFPNGANPALSIGNLLSSRAWRNKALPRAGHLRALITRRFDLNTYITHSVDSPFVVPMMPSTCRHDTICSTTLLSSTLVQAHHCDLVQYQRWTVAGRPEMGWVQLGYRQLAYTGWIVYHSRFLHK